MRRTGRISTILYEEQKLLMNALIEGGKTAKVQDSQRRSQIVLRQRYSTYSLLAVNPMPRIGTTTMHSVRCLCITIFLVHARCLLKQ